jgi:hypothetical protein
MCFHAISSAAEMPGRTIFIKVTPPIITQYVPGGALHNALSSPPGTLFTITAATGERQAFGERVLLTTPDKIQCSFWKELRQELAKAKSETRVLPYNPMGFLVKAVGQLSPLTGGTITVGYDAYLLISHSADLLHELATSSQDKVPLHKLKLGLDILDAAVNITKETPALGLGGVYIALGVKLADKVATVLGDYEAEFADQRRPHS